MSNGFAEATTAATVEHYTPDSVFIALGETYDLDPCHPTNPSFAVPVAKYVTYYLTKEMDGLATPWPAGTFVWMNPPYGRECGLWLAKLAAHGNGIALVFARTDTRMFHDTVTTADAVCFIKGRIRFLDQNGVEQDPAKAPSMLVAWGPRAAAALHRSGMGAVVSFKQPVMAMVMQAAIAAVQEQVAA